MFGGREGILNHKFTQQANHTTSFCTEDLPQKLFLNPPAIFINVEFLEVGPAEICAPPPTLTSIQDPLQAMQLHHAKTLRESSSPHHFHRTGHRQGVKVSCTFALSDCFRGGGGVSGGNFALDWGISSCQPSGWFFLTRLGTVEN